MKIGPGRISRHLRMLAVVFLCVAATGFGWNFFPACHWNLRDADEVSARLRDDLRYLSQTAGTRNYAHPENLELAAGYIEKAFKDVGYPVEAWEYEVGGQRFRNIVARYKNSPSEEYFLVGAHYDSCFTPGADDNASGVSGVLELARSLKGAALEHNILFVAFTNEEPPFFQTAAMGSRVFVRFARGKGITIRGAVVLDMIGFYTDKWFSQKYLPLMGAFYPNPGDFIAIVGNFMSRDLVDLFRNDLKKEKYFPVESIVAPESIPGISFSDHASFWSAGIPAIMITDTAYLRNPHYHKPTDTMDKIDLKKMTAVVQGLKKAVISLCKR